MTIISPDRIRRQFSEAISEMYQREVPLYSRLKQCIKTSNQTICEQNKQPVQASLAQEQHGAIRLGSDKELHTMCRFFNVLGMQPVGYYDLTTAGLPVHSTAFRPVDHSALQACPFRMFTSVLRIDLVEDTQLKMLIKQTLVRRTIFSGPLIALIETNEKQQGLTQMQADSFIELSLETFRWHSRSIVSRSTYDTLTESHPLLADIVSFAGPHINHLTPRTLDIDSAQQQMKADSAFTMKRIIEGPPKRQLPILLRQTSFHAQAEKVTFDNDGALKESSHTARFGEIEQRGAALTPKGRQLYDRLLSKTHAQVPDAQSNPAMFELALKINFKRFPDDLETLRQEGLIYVTYALNSPTNNSGKSVKDSTIEALIKSGRITCKLITYEDFLPISAAGIFRSNLAHTKHKTYTNNSNQESLEDALGRPVIDPFDLYESMQEQSVIACREQLNHINSE